MSSPSSATNTHPLLEIPGGYGPPIIGALRDRYDYFYHQGTDAFYRSRMEKYNSTVFRTNMPPGPGLLGATPKVIVLLDSASFPILFDSSKVEKRDVLDGSFLPTLSYTGGHRVCAYLDPSEPSHRVLKTLFLSFLASRAHLSLPIFRSSVASMFTSLESKMNEKASDHHQNTKETVLRGKADWVPLNDEMSFDFVFRLFCDPVSQQRRKAGPNSIVKWLFCQLSPLATLSPPKILIPFEDIILHTLGLPAWLARSDYKTLYNAFWEGATSFLDKAEEAGMAREEACHNLVFLAGFNAFGGMKAWFPSLIKWVGGAGDPLHRRLREEIRTNLGKSEEIKVESMEKMRLTESVIYEAFRMNPPVPDQYGRVKEDTVIQTHNASFLVKKGELLCGHQPFATKDPRVFERAEEFVGDRFLGEEGEKLVKYVYWSNGYATEDPTAENKQCAGKDLVLLLSRVLLVELFLRYDTFEVESGKQLLATTVKFLSLTKSKACDLK